MFSPNIVMYIYLISQSAKSVEFQFEPLTCLIGKTTIAQIYNNIVWLRDHMAQPRVKGPRSRGRASRPVALYPNIFRVLNCDYTCPKCLITDLVILLSTFFFLNYKCEMQKKETI